MGVEKEVAALVGSETVVATCGCPSDAMARRSCRGSMHVCSTNISRSRGSCASNTSSRIDQVEMVAAAVMVVVVMPADHQAVKAAKAARWV